MATRARGKGARRKTASAPVSGAPRTGAKRTVMYYIRQLPQYLRLLTGLITDRRVAMVDKLLVVGAIAYIVMPVDFIPDFIPFFGEVDDLYLLVMALQRLIANAGRVVLLDHWSGAAADLADLYLLVMALQRLIANAGRVVLLDHWSGAAADLADLNLRGALTAAAFFLPKRIRRRLRVIGRA